MHKYSVLRFCSDETMLCPTMHRKLLVPNNTKTPTLPDEMTLPHIGAMCCCNVLGDKMPPFIILPSLANLPTDLQIYVKSGEAMFASSSSGWQTRDTFLWFVIAFINWLSTFRLKLNKDLRNFHILFSLATSHINVLWPSKCLNSTI